MRIGIYGAGSIGCHVGGMMACSGMDPLLVGRDAMARRLAGGIMLTGHDGQERFAPPGSFCFSTSPVPLADCDCVLVAVKSPATREAGTTLAGILRPGTVVASFQNGVANAGILREELAAMEVLACVVGYNVAQVGPNRFHRGTDGAIMVGDGAGALALAIALLDAGLPAMVRRDIVAVQWGKLLLNLNNAVNALSGLPLRSQLLNREWRNVLAASIEEALMILQAAGIRPARVAKAPPALLPFLLRLPDFLFERVAASMLAIDGMARSSMAEDLERGRDPETDQLNGEIVRLAASIGRHAPVNAQLCAMVAELFATRPPVHPGPHEVLRRLGTA